MEGCNGTFYVGHGTFAHQLGRSRASTGKKLGRSFAGVPDFARNQMTFGVGKVWPAVDQVHAQWLRPPDS